MDPADYAAASAAPADRHLSVGRPLVETEVRILSPDGRPVPSDVMGEIAVRGPQVMRGYWKLPDATDEALRGGWLHTGDAGLLDADGYLYIRDRLKDVIITGGVNVYPRMVEHVLLEHPAVSEVAVIGVPDRHWGERVHAVVVRRPGVETSEQELVDFCRGRLGHFQCPRAIEFTESLPRTASGKILKRALRDRHWAGRERKVSEA